MSYQQELQYDVELEERKLRALDTKWYKLAEVYARKARIPVEDVIQWLETGKVNFSDLSRGILGVRIDG